MALRVVATVSTYPGSCGAWLRSRFAALVDEWVRRGLRLELALPIASAALVHLRRETGCGEAEHNYSIGNPKAEGAPAPVWRAGWHGDAMYLTNVDDGRQLYRAYASLRDGVVDYVGLLSNARYGPALAYLAATGDGVGWYDRLMRAGYHPWSQDALDEYASLRARQSADAQRP
jgi:hypothetical protein